MAGDVVNALPLRPDDADGAEGTQVSGYSALRGNNVDNRKGGRYLAMASPLMMVTTAVPRLGAAMLSALPSVGGSGQ